MKKVFLFFVLLIFFISPSSGQSVLFLKTITPHKKVTFSSRLRSLFFGRQNIRQTPFSLVMLKNGNIVMTDVENGSILLMDRQGTIIRAVKKIGQVSFSSPVGLCLDEKENIYVADSARMGIVKFDPSLKRGQLFASVPGSRLCGMAWLKNRLYCADAVNHLVRCFDASGKQVFSFGQRGSAPGDFNFPIDVASAKTHLYVLDALNFRVQVFDASGKFLSCFGENGTGGGSFSKPKAIAVNSLGYVFVSDVSFDNVQVFNSKGIFLYVMGQRGNGQGQFWMPSGIAFGSDLEFIVADTYNHRIQQFEIKGIEK
ncbi:MAG: hypothetical protein GXO70_09860 [Acidobacteria bacterium]|nr:hypothetical protein [Acidobacteriota bacterium]